MSISRNIYKTKAQYEKAFAYTETDDGDLGYFIQYNLKILQRSFDDLKEYLHRKQEEEEALFEFRSISGINERQARIIKIYHDKPHSVFTSKEFVASLGVTEKTIRTDLESLVKLGLLERVPRNKRLISYIASDAFDSRLREIKGE